MNILESTKLYERWLAERTDLVSSDIRRKHQFMAEELFPFFRATFYRWLQVWPKVCPKLLNAPRVLAVGDLHVENFGTWRDAEARLAWGINDFDQAFHLPYTQDLVRLAAGALLATHDGQLQLKSKVACDRIFEGYADCLKAGGQPFVLAEQHRWLRDIAQHQLNDPKIFWDRLQSWPTAPKNRVPREALSALLRSVPKTSAPHRIVCRQAGLGSRGQQRFVILVSYQGGLLAREAKSLAPPTAGWLDGKRGATPHYAEALTRAVRIPDPTLRIEGTWLIRRLAPDCMKIRLPDLPSKRNEERILYSMGWETANVHLGSGKADTIQADLKDRKPDWLFKNSHEMALTIRKDWKVWRSEFQG